MITSTSVNHIAKQIAEKSLQQEQQQPEQANPADQARFQDAVQNQGQNQNQAQAPTDANTAQGVKGPAEVNQSHQVPHTQLSTSAVETQVQKPSSTGDSILNSIDKMRNNLQDGFNQAPMKDMSPEQLQRQVVEFNKSTIVTSVAGQATGKIDQDVDMLLKGS